MTLEDLPYYIRKGKKHNVLTEQNILERDKIKKLYIEEIKRHVRKAEKLSHSEKIPDSHYKFLLMQAPSYVINRMLKEIGIEI